jgi:atypical dual specificity phosphatase
MWRPRDRERFIGSYDPEREMPDPDRGPGDRWQSDAYRHNARDTRFAYRWNPDRFEERYREEHGPSWRGDYGRGRSDFGGGYERDYGRDFADREYGRDNSAYNRDFSRDYGRDYNRDFSRDYGRDYGRDYDRGSYGYGSRFDRDRAYGSDHGWDYDRGMSPRRGRAYYEGDMGGGWDDYDRDRFRRR